MAQRQFVLNERTSTDQPTQTILQEVPIKYQKNICKLQNVCLRKYLSEIELIEHNYCTNIELDPIFLHDN